MGKGRPNYIYIKPAVQVIHTHKHTHTNVFSIGLES